MVKNIIGKGIGAGGYVIGWVKALDEMASDGQNRTLKQHGLDGYELGHDHGTTNLTSLVNTIKEITDGGIAKPKTTPNLGGISLPKA